MPKNISFESVYVTVQTLNEEVIDEKKSVEPADFNPSIVELLELLAVLPVREQAFMMMNMLTISGFQQKEIAKAMNIPYSTYRNTMRSIRQDFKKRGINGI